MAHPKCRHDSVRGALDLSNYILEMLIVLTHLVSQDNFGTPSRKARAVGAPKFLWKSAIHVFFYKKLRSGAGWQFLKFSGHFAVKSFLHVLRR